MTTADQEIQAFLCSSGTDAGRRLDVATVFARSMLRELRSAVAEWEATAAVLEEANVTRRRATGPDGASCLSGDAEGAWPGYDTADDYAPARWQDATQGALDGPGPH